MSKPTVSTVLWMVLACMLSMPVTAEEVSKTPNPIVEMSVSPTRIDWSPVVDAERWVLTISGPRELFIRRELNAGKAPSLSLVNSEGDRLSDGDYTWELRAVPSNPTGSRRASGSFSVQNGSFLTAPQATNGKTPKPPLRSTIAKDLIEDGDLIVKGNACIGGACTNSSADVDVLKLKATHPAIVFDEVGVLESASFDWGLLANPSDIDQFSIASNDGSSTLTPFTLTGGAPDNSLFVSATGKVGLGTASPGNRLHVVCNDPGETCAKIENNSATGFSGVELTDETGAALANIAHDNSGNTFRLNVINSEPMVFLTNSSERMRVTSAGKVGIGSTSPGAKLVIVDNAATETVQIFNSSSTGFPGIGYFDENSTIGLFIGLDNANNNTRINSVNNNPIVILTNSNEKMRITSAGDIGVGTSSPSSKFHVNGGDIRVSSGSFIDDGVTLNAPDYVFEPDYKLMPLEELRKFVTQEKHLPNVPNAREVKEQGLNLSQFQMRLLEKVEELTLYTLSQQEQIGSLHKENAQLKERLEALERTLQQP